jgi:hypothetical protein
MCAWRAYAIAVVLVFVGSFAYAQGDSIKVHGAWTIELRNPDGTVAARHQFNNALVPQGGGFLARLLGGTQTVTEWAVTLSSRVGETVCAPASCFLRQNPAAGQPGLTVEVPATGPNAGLLVMRGTVTADTTGIIQSVVTQQVQAQLPFSEKFLAPTIPVTAGQVITVTVVFSFS